MHLMVNARDVRNQSDCGYLHLIHSVVKYRHSLPSILYYGTANYLNLFTYVTPVYLFSSHLSFPTNPSFS